MEAEVALNGRIEQLGKIFIFKKLILDARELVLWLSKDADSSFNCYFKRQSARLLTPPFAVVIVVPLAAAQTQQVNVLLWRDATSGHTRMKLACPRRW